MSSATDVYGDLKDMYREALCEVEARLAKALFDPDFYKSDSVTKVLKVYTLREGIQIKHLVTKLLTINADMLGCAENLEYLSIADFTNADGVVEYVVEAGRLEQLSKNVARFELNMADMLVIFDNIKALLNICKVAG